TCRRRQNLQKATTGACVAAAVPAAGEPGPITRERPYAEERTTPMTRALIAALILLGAGAASPQSAVDDLLAADRAFAAASAKTDLVSGLTAMFADDVVIPMPPGQFVDGRTAVAAALRTNADNLTSRTDWTPMRGGISSDGQHGFT